MAKPCCWPNACQAWRSASDSGCRWRTVRAMAASPPMNSICGMSRLPSRPSMKADSAATRVPISGITVRHCDRSATKRGSCSRKPTRVLSFFSTRRTENRPLRRYPQLSPTSGASTVPGLTWPMRVRLSISTCCLATICWPSSRCCSTQPAQTPKCGQRGCTRCGEAVSTSTVRASSKWRLLPVCSAITVSPGSAPATKVTLPPSPSRRATPRPSWLRSRMSVWNGVLSMRDLDRATWRKAAGCGAPLSQMHIGLTSAACAARPHRQ